MTDRNEPAYPWGKNARGGLTKLQAAAIAMAQGMLAGWPGDPNHAPVPRALAHEAVEYAIALFDRIDAQQAHDEDRIPDVPLERLTVAKQEAIDYATAFLRRNGHADAAEKLAADWEIPF